MITKSIKGTLSFWTWFHPWYLTQENGQKINFFDDIKKVLENLNGKKVLFEEETGSFSIKSDNSSAWTLEFNQEEKEATVFIKKPKAGSNLGYHIPHALQGLNGMLVEISFSDTHFSLIAVNIDKVFTLKYTGDGNMAKIPKGEERRICKVKTEDACIFCSMTADGWECMKGSDTFANIVLHKTIHGETKATRIGDCLIKGREK